MNNSELYNAFTVDVEDYFQVESFSSVIKRANWNSYTCRVENNTKRILDLIDARNIKGTFFILGWIAKKYPNLVREINSRGHEIASHGMSHKLIYKQTETEFRQETLDSKALLEDIAGVRVRGYRAATYSITSKSLWALDVLVEAGYEYDSSIFPMRHDRYGISDAIPYPGIITTPSGKKLVEFPISTYKKYGATLPVAGGGYFRLFPYFVSKYGLGQINATGNPFLFYMHPWEIDVDQPRIDGVSMFTRFRHYNNLAKFEDRLKRLLGDFNFTSMSHVLTRLGLLSN